MFIFALKSIVSITNEQKSMLNTQKQTKTLINLKIIDKSLFIYSRI